MSHTLLTTRPPVTRWDSPFITSQTEALDLQMEIILARSNYTGTVGNYTDGTQGYQMGDVDGMATLTLDNVTADSMTFDLFVQGGSSNSQKLRLSCHYSLGVTQHLSW